MLIFKNNLYEKKGRNVGAETKHPIEYYEWFDPLHFVKTTLMEELDGIDMIKRQPASFWSEDAKRFYPNAHKIGPLPTLQELVKILIKGLEDETYWYHMNTYHFCVLYDVLRRYAYNYNHDSREERMKTLPELNGEAIHFDLFVRDYFFNTVFLMSEDDYASLSAEEKLKRGLTCPCQFGVINGLLPTQSEMALKETKDYPYSIYV